MPLPAWLAPLLTRKMLICVFTGFSSGLPLFLLLNLLPAWLTEMKLDLGVISTFTLTRQPFVWKFLWAPFLDRWVLPLGRRRGWMLLSQIGLLLCIGGLGAFDPKTQIVTVFAVASLLGFLSATQDIALDAYRREILSDAEQGLGTAVHVNAYRVAGLIPGSLSLILADKSYGNLPWELVFWITALFMLPGIFMTLMVTEPVAASRPRTLSEACVNPFREFIQRQGWSQTLLILSFLVLYKLGDSLATAMSTAFYLKIGFSMADIGLIAKHAGLWPAVIGGILGGLCMVRIGINRALWLFGMVQLITILGFAWLAWLGPFDQAGGVTLANRLALAGVISAEYLGVGLGTAAFTAFIARTTNPAYSATQFALFTSLAAVPNSYLGSASGFMVKYLGWFNFFLLCTVLAVPGMLLLFRVAPWHSREQTPVPADNSQDRR
jgi:PAT family beta-lactamase induction signal transducer AmpG